MRRREDWVERFHDFIEERKSEPFAWGTNDCSIFAADAVQAMTDVDFAEEYRGTYDSKRTAFVRIKEVTGGSTPEDVMNKIAEDHGFEELESVLFAQRGDVVIYDGEEGVALGVVYLNGTDAVFVAPDGLHKVPVKQCRRAWRV